MEQSRGKGGIPKIDAYGPYRMPHNLFEYGLNEWGQEGACPTGYTCNYRMEPEVDALWAAEKGADVKKQYDIVLRIYAGYDETSVWQEFGEMKFASKDDIPAEWGNPDTTKPRPARPPKSRSTSLVGLRGAACRLRSDRRVPRALRPDSSSSRPDGDPS